MQHEKDAIAFKKKNPGIGYKRLAYMMLDADIAAVSLGSVCNVLKEAGLSSKWTSSGGYPSKKGFCQPTKSHEQWYSDISYINILGTHYFFISILDGYSRYIVHHEVRTSMETHDVEIVVERAMQKIKKGMSPSPFVIN